MFFLVYFRNFVSRQFLQIIVRISLNFYFLTGDDFHPVFVDHLCFYL